MPLSDAMAKHPAAFDRLYVAMVRAGEASGALDQTLIRLATQLEKQDSLRRSIKSAMTYPILIAVFRHHGHDRHAAVHHPDLRQHVQRPGRSTAVPDPADDGRSATCSRATGSSSSRSSSCSIWALVRLKNTEQGRRAWDRFKLKLPMKLGPIIQKIAVARFSRTFATLVGSGVPILQAIDITGKTSGNTVIEEAMVDVKESVRSGESIAKPLMRVAVFPPMVTHMISIGEETGALDAMLNKIADFYEDEVDAAVKSLTSIIEPIMMMFVGGLVGLIVISMYLPMFNMMNLVK